MNREEHVKWPQDEEIDSKGRNVEPDAHLVYYPSYARGRGLRDEKKGNGGRRH